MMNWLNILNDGIVNVMDWVLMWIVWLPRDLAILMLAFLTSLILALSRKWCADQDWLRRSEQDMAVLTTRLRDAKKAKDREAMQRVKNIRTRIQVLSLRQEGKTILGALLPIGLLATWAFGRMGYVPPQVGETVEVRMYLPTSSLGQWAHMTPVDGLKAAEGWVQAVVPDSYPEPAGPWDRCDTWLTRKMGMLPPLEAVARWRLTVEKPMRATLRMRYAGRTYDADFIGGKRIYAPTILMYPDSPVQAVEAALKPIRLFGFVGGIGIFMLQPWIVGYLVLAIALMGVTKRLVRVA